MLPFKDELQKLDLPPKKYALFGSAVLAVRNWREANDLDIIVKKDLWNELATRYPKNLSQQPTCLKLGHLEIFKEWLTLSDRIDEMIDSAEIIDNLPFVRLAYFIEWKKMMGRQKDTADLLLLENYLNNR